MSINLYYKNLLKDAIKITETYKVNSFGTAYIIDDDIHSVYRSNQDSLSSQIIFKFGSAVSIKSAITITNINSSVYGDIKLYYGTTSDTSSGQIYLYSNGLGTSYKDSVMATPYTYWRISLYGTTVIGKHQLNEMFLGKKVTINEMPTYPFEDFVEEDVTEITSERGQRWIYYNNEKENMVLNFEGVNETTKNELFNLYKYVGKDTTPFWINLDVENDPFANKYVRFKGDAFSYEEINKNVYNIVVELEQVI